MVYVSFGSSEEHRHQVNGDYTGIDVLVKVESRERAFELFGRKFCTTYQNHQIDISDYKIIDATN